MYLLCSYFHKSKIHVIGIRNVPSQGEGVHKDSQRHTDGDCRHCRQETKEKSQNREQDLTADKEQATVYIQREDDTGHLDKAPGPDFQNHVADEVVVQNQVGLHARPATFFIQKANEYRSSVWIEKDERRVNAKSLLGVLSLGITKGISITLIADGPDEEKAVTELVDLVSSNFS